MMGYETMYQVLATDERKQIEIPPSHSIEENPGRKAYSLEAKRKQNEKENNYTK